MIFISVGTQLPFDRMIKVVDEWAGKDSTFEVIGQISTGEYIPKNFKSESYLPSGKFTDFFTRADVIISHAGMGNIITALELAKPIIIFPRRAELGEHRNNHQLATAEKFKGFKSVYVAHDIEMIIAALSEIKENNVTSANLKSNPNLINFLEETIDGWFK